MDKKMEAFLYFPSLSYGARKKVYESISTLEEVTVLIEEGDENIRYPLLIEELMDFLKECPYPIINFEGNLSKPKHAKLIKTLAETLQLVFARYTSTMMFNEKSLDFSIVLVENSKSGLLHEADGPNQDQDEEDLPLPPTDNNVPNNDVHKDQHAGTVDPQESAGEQPAGESNQQEPGEGLNQEPGQQKQNPLPEKKIVLSFGSFNPVTKDHIEMIKKVKLTAEHNHAEALVIIQADPYFSQDTLSMRVRSSVIEKLTKVRVVYDDAIVDFVKALNWVYNHHYTYVMIITGEDELSEMNDILQTQNGQETNEGKFVFNTIKVGSYGGNNPDKSKASIHAVNAIMDNDIDTYLSSIDLPNITDIRKLFYVARYELENKIGMTESVHFYEMTQDVLRKMLISKVGRNRLLNIVDNPQSFGYKITKIDPRTKKEVPLNYYQVVDLFRSWYRAANDYPDPQKELYTILPRLARSLFPQEYKPEDFNYAIVSYQKQGGSLA